jgi:hypothetical protein
MHFVVATRLQAQHPSFRLRTLSTTPYVPMNDAHVSFPNSDEGMRFPFCNFFVLRSAWTNRHNSRQGCNLEELANQSKLTDVLASIQWFRSQVEAC